MFGDERASAKEIKSVFGVASMPGLSGFRDNENWTRTCECGHPTSDSCKARKLLGF